ncbi:MAG: hypothetical protein MAG458_01068 [Nitrosopumilus sp.]|nr:hypothetical protein [Nitrosopumilus sp.]
MNSSVFLTIFVLVFGITSTSLVSDAYAQNDPDILLQIATQADKQIQNQLNEIFNNSSPVEIQLLYDKGHQSVKSLRNSLPDDVKQAKKDFLTAMKSFKEISKIISKSTSMTKSTNTSDVDFSSQLDRLEKYIKTLKIISKKHDTKVDFREVNDLIQEVRNQINHGIGNPSDTIDQLKRLITSIEKNIRDSPSHETSDRIKQFVNKQLISIEKKLDKALESGATKTQIDKAHELIKEIRYLISENQINNAKIVFHELNKLLKDVELSVN